MNTHLTNQDDFIQKLLDNPNKSEAFAWLDESTERSHRTLGELDSNDSITLVDELYKTGALEVLAVDIKTYLDGSQNTGKLIIILPSDSMARTRVFDWEAKQSAALGYDPTPDFGQNSLFVLLD